jgi:hypothetical protein
VIADCRTEDCARGDWSGVRESDPPSWLGKPEHYHYANPAFRLRIIAGCRSTFDGRYRRGSGCGGNLLRERSSEGIGLQRPQLFLQLRDTLRLPIENGSIPVPEQFHRPQANDQFGVLAAGHCSARRRHVGASTGFGFGATDSLRHWLYSINTMGSRISRGHCFDASTNHLAQPRMIASTSSRLRSICSAVVPSRLRRSNGSVFEARTLKCQSGYSMEIPSSFKIFASG